MTAEPPESPVAEAVRSLEVRWIFPGQLEAAVAGWFGRFPAGRESRQGHLPAGSLSAGAVGEGPRGRGPGGEGIPRQPGDPRGGRPRPRTPGVLAEVVLSVQPERQRRHDRRLSHRGCQAGAARAWPKPTTVDLSVRRCRRAAGHKAPACLPAHRPGQLSGLARQPGERHDSGRPGMAAANAIRALCGPPGWRALPSVGTPRWGRILPRAHRQNGGCSCEIKDGPSRAPTAGPDHHLDELDRVLTGRGISLTPRFGRFEAGGRPGRGDRKQAASHRAGEA